MQSKTFYVYILASYPQRLYIGLTSDLEGRMWQHRTKSTPGHTSKYNIDRLVHVEEFAQADDAIARERQLKNWSRQKKIDLIVRENPNWKDLAMELFDWSENEFRTGRDSTRESSSRPSGLRSRARVEGSLLWPE
jgi:putative endonuclease